MIKEHWRDSVEKNMLLRLTVAKEPSPRCPIRVNSPTERLILKNNLKCSRQALSLPLSLLARSARVAPAVPGHPEDALETVSLAGFKAARRTLCNSNQKNLLLTRTRVQPRCTATLQRNTW